MQRSFNFLASLINGNVYATSEHIKPYIPFNFLASLINGNEFFHQFRVIFTQEPFNFLASLINGN